MRILTLAAMGASAIALSGCSYLSGVFGHGDTHQTQAPSAQYNQSDDCCVGGPGLSTWNLEGGLGTDFIVGGSAFDGSDAPIAAEDIDMKDAFDTGIVANVTASRALNPNRKVTASVNYTKAEGQSFNIGAGQSGQLSEYKSLGIEAGLRQYFKPRIYGIGMRPYVEGKIGAAKVDDINLTVNPAMGASTTRAFYEGGWIPTAAALVGVETPVFKRATLGLETGLRYSGALKGDDSVDGTAFAGANNSGTKISIPLTIRGRYRF